jgi:hypothetical protein
VIASLNFASDKLEQEVAGFGDGHVKMVSSPDGKLGDGVDGMSTV